MRELVVRQLLGGQIWFGCAAVLLIIIAVDVLRLLDGRSGAVRAGRFLLVLLVPLSALTGTPVPLYLVIALAILWLSYAFAGFQNESQWLRRGVGAGLATLVLIAVVRELPYHARPTIDAGSGPIYVIGDSISSGGFGETLPWPDLLARMTGLAVVNLAQPSETTRSAMQYQVPKLTSDRAVVLEIGGNDLLDGLPAGAFEQQLDELLGALRPEGSDRPVLMFELPIPPGRWAFGAAQRRVARRHGAPLIPKRLLVDVLLDPGLVADGLHLTDAGHRRVAQIVARSIGRQKVVDSRK
ncbi:MAG TPA: GDSL-type esterase/lipase family protein [Thermoanaerobaculia bacterium]|nr:GDSL-type esterase/lipase family protein [Thermoanaerobaculia bacterium]